MRKPNDVTSAGNYTVIKVERLSDSEIVLLTLNRPEVHNALDAVIRYELSDALDRIASDSEVGALIITGAGAKSFSVGADIKNPESNHSVSDFAKYLPGKRRKGEWFDILIGFPKGVVSAVNGYCAGSGLQLAMTADVLVASANATFWLPQVGLGLAPHVGTLIRMARSMGTQRVMEMALTGRRLTADLAHRYGLVCEVTPAAGLLDAAKSIATAIAKQPRLSVQVTKEAFNQGLELSWEQAMRVDAWKEFCMYQTEARKNRHEAFVNKGA